MLTESDMCTVSSDTSDITNLITVTKEVTIKHLAK